MCVKEGQKQRTKKVYKYYRKLLVFKSKIPSAYVVKRKIPNRYYDSSIYKKGYTKVLIYGYGKYILLWKLGVL